MTIEEQRELLEDVLSVIKPILTSLSIVEEVIVDALDEPPSPLGVPQRLIDEHKRAIESLRATLPRPRPVLRLVTSEAGGG